MTALVRLVTDGPYGEIVLDRPRQLNAMSADLVTELLERVGEAERAGLRALLFRSEGRAFSAGRDISDAQPGTEDGGQVLADIFNPMVRRVADLPLPTIAAVQGACLGTGLGLALACDVVFAAHDAKIGSPFAQIGAVLDSGAHAALLAALGPHRTLELVYSGRLLSGREAAEWGLVNRSVDGTELLDVARDFARTVANGPTAAFGESKRLIRRLTDHGLSLQEVLDAEAQAQSRASKTEDYVEGFTAFLQKRTPTFKGR